MVQVVAVDLDGTLLDEEGYITGKTKGTIEKLSAGGTFFVPATGRCWDEIPDDLLEIKGIQYAILSNGARIVDLKHDRTLFVNLLEQKDYTPLFEIINTIGLTYDLVSEGSVFVDECFMEDVLHYFKATGKAYSWMPEKYRFVKNLPSEVFARSMKVEKFSLRRIPIEKINTLTNFFTDHPEFEVTSYVFHPNDPLTLEISSQNSTKGHALQTLCSMLELDISETMAIGDGYNDISMLSAAGFGVAMGNAVDEAKAAADYVTLTNGEEGVGLALRKFLF